MIKNSFVIMEVAIVQIIDVLNQYPYAAYVIVIPRSPGIYRGKPPDPEGAARARGVVFRDKSMVTVV